MCMSRVLQQLLSSKSHDFSADFALAHSKINQIAKFLIKLSKVLLTRLRDHPFKTSANFHDF
jgi:hypothetical protein